MPNSTSCGGNTSALIDLKGHAHGLQRTSLYGFHATKSAERADELARAYLDAVNASDDAALESVLARTFLSYAHDVVRSRTATKKYYADLRTSFSDLHFQVRENIGVLVENDLVALRTIVTGVHTGDYAGVPGTETPARGDSLFKVTTDSDRRRLRQHRPPESSTEDLDQLMANRT